MRATRRTKAGTESRWTPIRKRNEVKDCCTYAIWLEERLDLWSPRKAKWWDQLEQQVQPDDDLFSAPMPARVAVEITPATAPPSPPVPAPMDSRETSQQDFGSSQWSARL